MSRRRRLHPPWIPGFWSLVAFLLLLTSVLSWYYVLAQGTQFCRLPEKAGTGK